MQINTRIEGLQAFWRIGLVFKAMFINKRNELKKCEDNLIRTSATQVGMNATASEKQDDWLERVLQKRG